MEKKARPDYKDAHARYMQPPHSLIWWHSFGSIRKKQLLAANLVARHHRLPGT